jgi:N-acetylated-alpha-linked acidic dipeptidase
LTLPRILPYLLLTLTATAQTPQIFGFHDPTQQAKWDTTFLAVPDPKLAGDHLRILTAAPHWASSPEDYATALYVADKFRAANLQTEIIPYRVLLNKPVSLLIEAFDADGKRLMSGPSPEHVDPDRDGGDAFQDDPRILPAFNGSSPSGDITAEVVYANYGTLADFRKLTELGISVRGKIVLCRYGENFRGIKAYIAQQYGAKGVLIYSDPADDGYFKGDAYPKGPYRPESSVERGSVQFLPVYPGDPTTPGFASTADLPASKRLTPAQFQIDQPSIPVNPLSAKDAEPILKALTGQESPREWQGALPFTYHLGAESGDSSHVTVHMKLLQDSQLRIIWNVIGTIPGTDPLQKKAWVVAGNHRDAWVYGAVDPNSGTAAMLETVHGLGELLKQGWRPRRTIVIASWDAEEEGLIGSTEWVEQHDRVLRDAVAYFNTDIAVAGPEFGAAAVPSLKQFVREVTREVPSPAGGTVYDQWKLDQEENHKRRRFRNTRAASDDDVHVGDLGSGSDYTPFLQHLGVPATDIGSSGPYGVYHSVFDNYAWFLKFADPTFVLEQQQARILGLEVLHMADADVLPYDEATYGQEIVSYLDTAEDRALKTKLAIDFTVARAAANRFAAAGAAVHATQSSAPTDSAPLNTALRAAEAALLNPIGLPARPWYKHTIYAPGEFTGYTAVVIPGVNEGIDAADTARAQGQLTALTGALNRAATILEAATK